MKNILVLALAGIGDSLLFTPTLNALKKIYPQAKITALVRDKPVKELLERNQEVDEVLHYSFMKEGYIKSLLYVLQLRRQKYDLSILAYPANRFQHNMISFLIGAKQRLGHTYDIRNFVALNFLHTKKLQLHSERHTIDENLALLNLLGISARPYSKETTLPLTTQEEAMAKTYFKQYKLTKKDFVVGIHAGSSKLAGMANKRWKKERFAQVADKLVKEKKATILLFGGEDELHLREEIRNLMKSKAILVRTGSIFETAAVIKHCNLFLSNDTGLMHLAANYTIPAVVVSGHINPNKTKPLHKKLKYLTPKKVCKPYHIGENLTCKYKGTANYCLNQITVEEVEKAVEEVLQ